jgi:predicted  nucleic acid-binding Zn-ribbon protein
MASALPAILRECHRLRRHLRDLHDEISRGPRVLKARQTALATAEQEHKDHYEAIKALKLKQKADEGTLKQIETQLDKLGTRAMEVTTMKEMEATRNEIAMATERKNAIEDAILASLMEIEERTTNIPAVDQAWADAQAEFKQYQVDAKERLDAMTADQAECMAKLAALDASLPEEVRSVYDRVVKKNGPDGLAAVKARACQQCRTVMTEDKFDQLVSGHFLCCPNCGRGLYPAE